MNWFKSWFTKDKETPTTVEPELVTTAPSEPEIKEPQYEYIKGEDGVIWRIQKYTKDELKPFYKDKALYLPYEESQRITVEGKYEDYSGVMVSSVKCYTIKYRIISEPVVSFVETVRNNPSRFIIKKEETENKIDRDIKTIQDYLNRITKGVDSSYYYTPETLPESIFYEKENIIVKTIKDTKTGISFSETVKYVEGDYRRCITLSDNCKWVSEDELKWAKGEISLIYKERAKKLEDIKKVRGRRYLMKIYYTPNTVYEEK